MLQLEAVPAVEHPRDLSPQALEQVGGPEGLVPVAADCAWHCPVLLIVSLDQNKLTWH